MRHDPLWYKDAIIYELHVRSFYDSVTDGIGDFVGLAQKLDYLEDLGVTAIWLLPFCPSPLRDDGYDISNYTDVHPSYGTLKDFQRFLSEAHRRGLRVITELVLNHTSDQHVWFQRSRNAEPGSKWRNFYVWSDTPEKYKEARIIFKDFETSNWTWDPVAKAYYWHRFYSHQPDLNWDNPEVKAAMFAALDFWFGMGVDGLRLDAVPYLFEREGTICENLPETHQALRELREHVDSKHRDKMLLAEANQWPEDSAAYFGNGDECHMAFHFPVMPRLFMSLRMENRYPLTDIMRLTPSIPENCQWAMFLRNHDELTLEMVTDEERDYMYRTYAHDRAMRINLGIRRRLAPLLENDRRKIELMNALLFSLPGTPVIYYGDEIGMGDNIYLGDRNGVRTPMQWSADRNAGFSRANPQKLYLPVNIDPQYHYEAVNVESQRNNPHSLFWWMKRMIAQRNRFQAFGRGSLEFLYPANRKILAFLRQFKEENVLVVANLSRFTQCVELDLTRYKDMVPVEVFGHGRFPVIGEQKYFLSLGPHAFQWFHLEPRDTGEDVPELSSGAEPLPSIAVGSEEEVFFDSTILIMCKLIPRAIRSRPWFRRMRGTITALEPVEFIPVSTHSVMLMLRAEFSDGEPQTFLASLALATGERADALVRESSNAVLLRVNGLPDTAVVYGAAYDRGFAEELLTSIVKRRKLRGRHGDIAGSHTPGFRRAWQMTRSTKEPTGVKAQLRSSMIEYGEDFVLKLYRRVEPGVNPEKEMLGFLTNEKFGSIASLLGSLEYTRHSEELVDSTTVGILTRYLRNTTNGWAYTVDHLGLFFERALTLRPDDNRARDLRPANVLELINEPVPALITEMISNHGELMRKFGQRTAEMHSLLASRTDLPDFVPEPFTDFYRHGLYHGMLGHVSRTMDLTRLRLPFLPLPSQEEARRLLMKDDEIRTRLHHLRDTRLSGLRIRLHGNLQLDNVLFTGNDLLFTGFGGAMDRPLTERRIKRSALRDVASVIRSLHYAAHAVLFGQVPGITLSSDTAAQLERWAHIWSEWVSAIFLQSYREAAAKEAFLPSSMEETRVLLDAYLLEKALAEVEYELENRPEWVRIPIHGIIEQLNYRI